MEHSAVAVVSVALGATVFRLLKVRTEHDGDYYATYVVDKAIDDWERFLTASNIP
jgi:hypothetical protein